MCHSDVVKLQQTLETAGDEQIKILNQKVQEASARASGLETKLLSVEKKSTVSLYGLFFLLLFFFL